MSKFYLIEKIELQWQSAAHRVSLTKLFSSLLNSIFDNKKRKKDRLYQSFLMENAGEMHS